MDTYRLIADNYLNINSANMITLDLQTLNVLVDGTLNTLQITFV